MQEKEQIVVITGANSGMGLAAAIEIAKTGARVIMVCRHVGRGENALEEAKRQSGSDKLELMACDLGSLASIRAFAEKLTAKYPVIDTLINNAGVYSLKRKTTTDGFESMMGVNHLGHFLLTHLLLDALKKAPEGRIVIVASSAHKSGRIHFDDPHFRVKFNSWKGYAQSKLANVMFASVLADRLKSTLITVNALHPGAVGTNIGVDRESGFGQKLLALARPFLKTPLQGAETIIYLALSPEVTGVSGKYFIKKKTARANVMVADPVLTKKLWHWSEEQVGL